MNADDPAAGLQRAAQLFAERCAQPDPEPVEAFLHRHRELREWLEPMLREEPIEEADGPAPIDATRLGPYRLLRELGRGGMGVVHEARRGDDPTPLALKVLPGFLAMRGASVARFHREAELAQRLDHPGIVRVLDAGSVGDIQYLAMAFVVGAPLDQVLLLLQQKEPQRLTAGDLAAAVHRSLHVPTGVAAPAEDAAAFAGSYVACVVKLVVQVAEALAHAHEAGVIHRDVKPSNLLVGADGSVVLLDLGLARETGASSLTLTGDFAGTPHFVSPEQAMAKRVHVDHRTDLFSLGSTFYELLTLRRAFAGETTQEVLGRILSKEPPSLLRLHPGLPEDLATVVAKLLEKDPDRRYRDAGELAADLRAFLDYRPVAARRASRLTRTLRWMRREPVRATLALVLAVAIPALTGAAGYLYARRDEIKAGREQLLAQTVAQKVDRGFLAYMQDDPTASIREFEGALALAPDCTEAQVGMLHALQHRDGPAPALQYLERHLAGRLPAALCDLHRFQLLKVLGRDREANAALVRVPAPRTEFELFEQGMIHRDRATHSGAELLQYIERAVIAAERPRLWIHLHWAVFADAANDAASCRRCAANLQLNWPDSPEACYFTCVALRHVDPEQAGELLRAALAAHPDVGLLHCADGVLRGARGDRQGAIAAFKRGVARSPTTPAFHYALGKSRFEAGDTKGALADLQEACRLSPRFVDAWIGVGMAQRRAGELDASLASLSHAVELNSSHAEARFQLGQTLVRLQRLPEALVELRAAVNYHPGDPNKWHHLASALFASGDDAGGLACLREAVAAAPGYERGHEVLVMYLQQEGTPGEAREALLAWAMAIPGSVNAWLRFGLHCASPEMPLDLRDGASAMWAARRALALTHDQSATAWLLQGEAQAMLGQTTAARTSLRRSLENKTSPLSPDERRLCERRLWELSAPAAAAPGGEKR